MYIVNFSKIPGQSIANHWLVNNPQKKKYLANNSTGLGSV